MKVKKRPIKRKSGNELVEIHNPSIKEETVSEMEGPEVPTLGKIIKKTPPKSFCDICHRQFATAKSYASHYKKVHNGCSICEMTFVRSSDMKKHMTSTHKDLENEDKCDEKEEDKSTNVKNPSPKGDKTVESVVKIPLKVKENKLKTFHSCLICKKKFDILEDLNKHVNTDHGFCYECRVCKRKFKIKTELKEHEFFAHKIRDDSEDEKAKEKIQPKKGSKEVKESKAAKDNKKDLDNDLKKKNALTKNVQVQSKKIKCDNCSETFSTKSEINKHILETHAEKPEKHQCNKCPQNFNSKTELNEHILQIHDGKPHSCEFCGKSFAQSETLKWHLKLTHKKDFQASNNEVKIVEEKKAPEKSAESNQNKCEFCPKSFPTDTKLNRHMKDAHTIICKECNQVFRSYFQLKRHKESECQPGINIPGYDSGNSILNYLNRRHETVETSTPSLPPLNPNPAPRIKTEQLLQHSNDPASNDSTPNATPIDITAPLSNLNIKKEKVDPPRDIDETNTPQIVNSDIVVNPPGNHIKKEKTLDENVNDTSLSKEPPKNYIFYNCNICMFAFTKLEVFQRHNAFKHKIDDEIADVPEIEEIQENDVPDDQILPQIENVYHDEKAAENEDVVQEDTSMDEDLVTEKESEPKNTTDNEDIEPLKPISEIKIEQNFHSNAVEVAANLSVLENSTIKNCLDCKNTFFNDEDLEDHKKTCGQDNNAQPMETDPSEALEKLNTDEPSEEATI